MKDITLVIPAKSESDSLPKVLNELKKFSVKKMDMVVLFPKEYFQLKQNTSAFSMLTVLLTQNILKK